MEASEELTGRIALVTGAGRGIGRSVALALASKGASVVIHYNESRDGAEKTANEIRDNGQNAMIVQANIGVAEDVEAMITTVIDSWEKIDVLVNNSGVIKDNLIIRMSEDDWDYVMNIDLKGVFLTTRLAARSMIKQRWGRIINIGSVVGLAGNPGQSNYAAAKAGLIGFTRSVAKELAPRNITVNMVAPGYIVTDVTENLPDETKDYLTSMIPMKRRGQPEEIADAVAFLAGQRSTYITGQTLNVDGGIVI
ncbi:MAG: 3-oxoacyl-[acyl-carrier-protein] reductase [SAR202 cluster bacterium]|nr:3-oxoacyl-[acyl-carrier-protein] reductase [SAR202 cluster bacterium]